MISVSVMLLGLYSSLGLFFIIAGTIRMVNSNWKLRLNDFIMLVIGTLSFILFFDKFFDIVMYS